MESYRRNIGEVTDLILESDLAQKVMEMADKGFKDRTKKLAQSIGWATTAAACKELVSELRLLAPALAKKGIHLDADRILHGNKVIFIEKMAEATPALAV